uniref:Uncharacterized protein n=1 Tax=Oryza meridionalis TaxID=40149 RepID=A0A0E0DJP7_9ORYZ
MAWRPSSEWWRGDPSVRGGVGMHPGEGDWRRAAFLLKVPNVKAGTGGRSSSEPVRVAAPGYIVHGMPPDLGCKLFRSVVHGDVRW